MSMFMGPYRNSPRDVIIVSTSQRRLLSVADLITVRLATPMSSPPHDPSFSASLKQTSISPRRWLPLRRLNLTSSCPPCNAVVFSLSRCKSIHLAGPSHHETPLAWTFLLCGILVAKTLPSTNAT
ncbi:unnamed protein product [Arabis nemorensis]|uniref:Uncharacterized protein n=1 Tax=Arabis nemorensis TaxID=586526 RepID=A0A565BCM0_9BRAS|nr:unnamed protein product [Arabis nemorensis]